MKASMVLTASALVGSALLANAADMEAGKERAQACGACHGANGISVADNIPNLAGQKAKYLVSQLKAFKAGVRKNQMMNPIASQLSDEDIDNLAAHWSSLPGASGNAKSDLNPMIVKTRVTFPEDYKRSYTYYTTIDFPKRKQVRKFYANKSAAFAARDGKPLPHGSKFLVEVYSAKLDDEKKLMKRGDALVADELKFYTAMETQPGWGNDIPDLYRNADWNYAVFSDTKELRPNVNQALCFACHKPLDKDSYVFSLAALKKAAAKQ